MPVQMEIIEKSRIFELLTPEQTTAVWALLHPHKRELRKDDILIYDGQRVQDCAIVQSGTLSANKLYADGHLSLVQKFFPAYVVGVDIAATKTQRSTYYVTALSNSVVYLFDYDALAKQGRLPETERLLMMQSVLALIAGENLRKMNQIEILSRKGVREKILTYLSLQSSFHQSREFQIPFNREEMAEYLCLNRSKLSHELSLMQKEGLIQYKKNYFKVIDAVLYRYE